MATLFRGALGATLLVLAALSLPANALAHARYKSSTPGAGEVLATSPAQVDITFTQHIQKVSGTYAIDVMHDRGAPVTAGPAVVNDADRTKMSVPLQADLSPGRYVVNWRNTSDDDGHDVNGSFSFYLNTQPNPVDLANDAQLAQVGFEDVTAAAQGTPSAAASTPAPAGTPASGPTTAASGTRSPASSAVAPIPTSTSTSSSSGSRNTVAYATIGAIVVIALVGLGVWQYVARRSS